MAGIASTEIDLYARSKPSLLSHYCGTYAIDELVEDFVNCATKIMKGITAKLPFAIVNTDPISKDETHWMSLIKLQDHSFFLFVSFGLLGFSQFILSNDKDLISEFLTEFKSYTQSNFKYYSFKFDANAFLSRTKKERKSLTDTCQGLMLFLRAFAIAADAKTINVYGLEDQLQLRTTSTCGEFVLYFLSKVYRNDTEKICKVKTCTIFTIRDIISSSFPDSGTPTGRVKNEYIIKDFITDNSIEGNF